MSVQVFVNVSQRLQQTVEDLKRLLKEAEEDQRFRDAEVINLTLEALKSDVIKVQVNDMHNMLYCATLMFSRHISKRNCYCFRNTII